MKGNSNNEFISRHNIGDIFYDPMSQQRSFIATSDFKKGDVVHEFRPKQTQNHPTYLTVQTSETKHIVLDPEYLAAINHSCDPNVYFDVDRFELRCVRDIKKGEELSYFYPSTEWQMIQPFDCNCGSAKCLGYIQGAHAIDADIIQTYDTSSFIQSMVKETAVLI